MIQPPLTFKGHELIWKTEISTEQPDVKDFYPKGKLYGIKIPNNISLPSEILNKYSLTDIMPKAQQKLLHDIILTPAKWAKNNEADLQIHTTNSKDTLTKYGYPQPKNNQGVHWIGMPLSLHHKQTKFKE